MFPNSPNSDIQRMKRIVSQMKRKGMREVKGMR
jgi:hypothetical protein